MPDEIFYFRESDIPPAVEDIAPEVFEPIRLGLKNELLVEIAYQGGYSDNPRRRILPEVIFRCDESWYVAAFCHVRKEPRTFRLDRISEAVLTDVGDASHGIAEDIRDNGIPWKRGLWEDEPPPSPSRPQGLWIKMEIVEGENGPEIQVSGAAANDGSENRQRFSCDLVRHAEEGNIERMKEDIAAGADVNFQTGSGEVPFVSAARRGHLDAMKFLLEHGADPLRSTAGGDNALHAAVRSGKTEPVRWLVEEHRLDVNARDCLGWTPLYLAALDNYPETAQYLLEHGADINAKTRDGATPLMAAAKEFLQRGRQMKTAKLLLGSGAEVDLRDKDGRTALFYAIEAKNPKIVALLLDAGASIDRHDKKGASPLLFALQDFKTDSEWRERNHPEWKEDTRPFEKVVQLLVEHGASLDSADKRGITPLMPARGKVLKYLLDRGAYAGAYDRNGKTVAMYHIEDPKELRLLRDHGADLTARDRNGNGLLLSAPMKFSVIRPLVSELKLPLDTRNAEGNTLLHRACKESVLSVVRFLLRHGADPDARNNDGKTPEDVIRDRLWEEDNYDTGEDYDILEFFSRFRHARKRRKSTAPRS